MLRTSHPPFATVALACALAWPAPAVAAAPAQPHAINPCALLSTEEVSAVMGQAVEPGRFADNGLTKEGAYSTTCLWAVALPPGVAPDPNKSLGGRSFAILHVMNWPGGPNDARKFLDDFRSAFESQAITSEPVPVQVGADEALWWGDGVAARKDGVSFGMSVATAGDRAARRPKAESLARLVVQRLARTPG
jgi:hypothetical protein